MGDLAEDHRRATSRPRGVGRAGPRRSTIASLVALHLDHRFTAVSLRGRQPAGSRSRSPGPAGGCRHAMVDGVCCACCACGARNHGSSTAPSSATATWGADPRKRRASPSSASSVRSWRWWKRTTDLVPARRAELDRVVGDGVPEARPRRRAPRETAARRGRARRRRWASSIAAGWYSPKPSSPGPEGRGAVVGHVGERRVSVADPVAERPPALVRDLARKHVEALDRAARPARSPRTSSLPCSPVGPDREVRRAT